MGASTRHAELLAALGDARERAHAPVSGFRVGAVVRGLSGRLHLGANLEVEGQPLHCTVHAEQAAVHAAWSAGEGGITAIATSAAPCGHCRQFLAELHGASSLEVAFGERIVTLPELLPDRFGPHDLGVTQGLLAHVSIELVSPSDDPLVRLAVDAAAQAYAPYTEAHAAVALLGPEGRLFVGRLAENAAFNPTLPPLLAAVSAIYLAGLEPKLVERAVLVERSGKHPSQASSSRTLWSTLGAVPLEVVLAT